MPRKLRRLAELSPGEGLLLLQLIVFSLAARVGLRLVALPRVMAFFTRRTENHLLGCFPLRHSQYEIARLTALADLATRVTHGQGRCLPRALLLLWLLKARGEPAELFIGINKEAAALQGHAWIESQGKIVADSPDVTGRFVTLLRF